MKEGLKYFMVIVLILTVFSANTKAATIDGYVCKTISTSGSYTEVKAKNIHKEIVRSYDELVKLKKYIRKNYANPKKYIKKLNRYKKSYFKKKALIFATESVDLNCWDYKLETLAKKKKSIVLTVKKISLLKVGEGTIDVMIYGTNTYIVEIKKNELKNIRKIKVKYRCVDYNEG